MMSEDDIPWHMRSKDHQYQMFQMQPEVRIDYSGRSDFFVGYSMVPSLLERFHSVEIVRSSDYSICGETFCYLKIDGINGLDGSIFEDKSQIEETLDLALRQFKVGCVIGSGTGLRYSYIDFAITDFSVGSGIIRKVLCAGRIPKRSWIMFFETDRAEEWLCIWDDTPLPPL